MPNEKQQKVNLELFHPRVAQVVEENPQKFDIRVYNTYLSKGRHKVIQYSGRINKTEVGEQLTIDMGLWRYTGKILIISPGNHDTVIIGPFDAIPKNRFTTPQYAGKLDQVLLDVTEITRYSNGAFKVFSLREGTLSGSQIERALEYIKELMGCN